MPDHDANPADDPALTPRPGTEPNGDEPPPRAPRRLPKINLAAISLPKFGRKKSATGGDATTSAAPPEGGYELGADPEAPRRRFPKVAWHKMPLANARRETRVGAAALASFLILVAALVINKGFRKPATADSAASGTLLALNAKDGDAKDAPPEPDAKPDPAPRAGTEPIVPPAKPSTRRSDPAATSPPGDLKPPADPNRPAPSPGDEPIALAPPGQPRGDSAPTNPAPAAAKPPPDPLAAGADTPPGLPAMPAPAVASDLPAMDAPPATAPPIEPLAVPDRKDPAGGLAASPLGAEGKASNPGGPPSSPSPPAGEGRAGGQQADAAAQNPSPFPPSPGGRGPERPSNPAPPAEPAPLDPFPKADPLPAPEPRPLDNPSRPAPAEPLVSTPAPEPTSPAPVARPPAFTKPPIESEPAPAAESAPSLPPGARAVRSLGKRRMPDPEPEPARLAPAPVVADAPLSREEVGARDQEDPILHTVESGENFWTISRTYYGSGRYYQALHAANRRLVPKIDELYVGTTIKVPPKESLDPGLIDPATRSRSSDDSATRASRSQPTRPRAADDGRAVPTRTRGDVSRGQPSRREVDEPTRPTYRTRAHDTLRSIARDTLGDPHRYREILDLNRDAIDDPNRLEAGVILTLPEDATIRDR